MPKRKQNSSRRAIRKRGTKGKVIAKQTKQKSQWKSGGSFMNKVISSAKWAGSNLMNIAAAVPRAAPVIGYTPRATAVDETSVVRGGKRITILSGCMPFAFIRKSDGTQAAIQYINGTSVTNNVVLHPSYVFPTSSNPSMTSLSHTEFRFTKLSCHYDSRSTTASSGSFLLGYFADGAVQSSDIGSNQYYFYALPGTVSLPIWAGGPVTDFSSQLASDWFYMDSDDTSDASRRQSYQGSIAAIWDTLPASAYWGYIFCDFVLELRNPRPNIDIALMRGDQRGRKISPGVYGSSLFERKMMADPTEVGQPVAVVAMNSDAAPLPVEIKDSIALVTSFDAKQPVYLADQASVSLDGCSLDPLFSAVPIYNDESKAAYITGGNGEAVNVNVVGQFVDDDIQVNQPFIIAGSSGAEPVPVSVIPAPSSLASSPVLLSSGGPPSVSLSDRLGKLVLGGGARSSPSKGVAKPALAGPGK